MNTNIDGLKAIYVALGGNSNTADGFGSNAEALNAIATLLNGDTNGATTNAELLNVIANVADGLIKPTGTKSITENGTNIDVAQYAKADVHVFTYEDMFNGLIDSSIEGVDIPTAISTIGDYKFYNCTNLSLVNISPGIQTIGEYAFAGCTSLESIVIPTDMRYINQGAFDGCTSLTDIYYTGTQARWEQITIGTDAIPAGATIHYEYTPE